MQPMRIDRGRENLDGARAGGARRQEARRSCTRCGGRTKQRATGGRRGSDVARSQLETALAKLRQEVEANSSYVGGNFAKEARAMHDGTAPERAIYGEAKPEEARQLIEDGVPVMPLPFIPKRKTN